MAIWLTGRFDRSMVGHALTEGALRKFLASDDRGDWAKACRALYHLTSIVFVNDGSVTEKSTSEAHTVLDDYWLKELINTTAAEFGGKVGKDAADIFLSPGDRCLPTRSMGEIPGCSGLRLKSISKITSGADLTTASSKGFATVVLGWLDADPDAGSTLCCKSSGFRRRKSSSVSRSLY